MLKADTTPQYFLAEDLLPKGFIYPESFIGFVEGEIPDLEPWRFFYVEELDSRFIGLSQRYPDKVLIPFARREDNDDIACFDGDVRSDNPKVLIIHDFASQGWEERGSYDDYFCWLEAAKIESEEWRKDN